MNWRSLGRNLLFVSSTFFFISLAAIVYLHAYSSGWPIAAHNILLDIAKALMAASLIGLFVHLAEVQNYFSQLIRNLVVDKRFIALLSNEELEKHGIASLEELIRRNVTNENHLALYFARPICRAFIPHLTSWYRENYNENIEYTALSPKEAIDRINSDLPKGEGPVVLVDEFDKDVYLLESTTVFSLIPPQSKDSDPFRGRIELGVAGIPGVPAKSQVWASIKIGSNPEEVLTLKEIEKRGRMVVFEVPYEILGDAKSIPVQIRSREYNYSIKTQLSMEMVVLTKGLSVVFSSHQDVYPEASLFGVNVGSYEPLPGTRSVSIGRSDVLLLPGDGYSISWSPPFNNVTRR